MPFIESAAIAVVPMHVYISTYVAGIKLFCLCKLFLIVLQERTSTDIRN